MAGDSVAAQPGEANDRVLPTMDGSHTAIPVILRA